MINIKMKRGNTCNVTVTDENGTAITDIHQIEIDMKAAKRPTAKITVLVGDLELDGVDVQQVKEKCIPIKVLQDDGSVRTWYAPKHEDVRFVDVGMALVNGNIRANKGRNLPIDNESIEIMAGDRIKIAGYSGFYDVVSIKDRAGIRYKTAIIEIDRPLVVDAVDNAVIHIYRK